MVFMPAPKIFFYAHCCQKDDLQIVILNSAKRSKVCQYKLLNIHSFFRHLANLKAKKLAIFVHIGNEEVKVE